MTPRRLIQPGPALAPRVATLAGATHALDVVLEPGLSLLEAVARPMRRGGFRSAVLELSGGAFGPFAYVLPAASPDPDHAAWYSAPQRPPGGARLDRGCVTFGQWGGQWGGQWDGQRDEKDWLHAHGLWQEAAGRRVGHILPEETILAAPIQARAWGLSGMGFTVGADRETNFSLFGPVAAPARPGGTPAVAVRVRPNEDLATALEAACARHGFARAVLRGSLGSLVGARFADGGRVEDHATEFLLTRGEIGPAGASLSVALAGMDGEVTEGRLVRGANPVCITFEGILEAA